MNWGNIIQATCENVLPPADSRCSDPAFALNNPDICPVAPFLVLKPAIGLLCAFGSIQLQAVYTKDGAEEDVTEDTIFSSSDPSIAVVGATSGNATGVAEGSATFRAVYNDGTQNHEAFSTINVLGENCCEDQSVAIMVCVDNSKSMSLSFGAGYQTRLAYAKAAATRFINEVNETKDVVGLLKFHDALTEILSEPDSDKAAVSALVTTISQTQQLTSFHECITQAVLSLDAVSGSDRKIIVIISDGEDSTASYNDSNNPIAALDDFKSAGGIVMCLGVRAHGRGFALLSRFSTGGFFVNGYGSTAVEALDYISGLKGYLCAGNCVPDGDEYVASGDFNYNAFINWDVAGGYVDLQGNGFFDYLPGNGLYVDLISGMQPSGDSNGQMVLKDAEGMAVESGKTYRLTVTLAGNQQVDRVDTVQVRAFWIQGATEFNLINQVVVLSDYTQDFSDHSFAFTADANRTVFISIQQLNAPSGDYARAGVLLSRVRFDNTSDFTSLFDDDFDGENLEYVPPACGTGTIYTSGGYVSGYYGCYGEGCLDEPPPEQLQDPFPLKDIEGGGTPPQIYESTKKKCASCLHGFINIPTGSDNEIPTMTSATTPSGTVVATAGATSGFEAWKVFDGDDDTYAEWLGVLSAYVGYQFSTGQIITYYAIQARSDSVLGAPRKWTFEGSNNGSSWTALDGRTLINWYAGELKEFKFNNATEYTYYRLNIINTSGAVEDFRLATLKMFSEIDDEVCATATETSEDSQQAADTKASAAALAAAEAQLNCVSFFTSTQSYTARCQEQQPGTFGANVTKSATRTSLVSQKEADDEALAAATAEAIAALDCTGSNNTQRLCILDETDPNPACDLMTGGPAPTEADPYPSVKYVSSGPVTITKVTVTLRKWNHGNYADCAFLLVSPQGTAVQFIGNVMDAPFDSGERDFIVDDDAADPFPEFSRPVGAGPHTYQPTIYVGQLTFPSPAPAGPYATTLNTFAGESPLGSWALYCVDDANLDAGYLQNGWDLTIT